MKPYIYTVGTQKICDLYCHEMWKNNYFIFYEFNVFVDPMIFVATTDVFSPNMFQNVMSFIPNDY